METQSSGVAAWLMQVDRSINVAVGRFEIIHIVDSPEYIAVPQAPEHCKHVILWDDHIVPVMNLSSWISTNEQSGEPGIVAILTYRNTMDELQYGGIKLDSTPVLENVKNDQQCPLPESNSAKWKSIAISCFKSAQGDIVPIIDVTSLFSQTLTN